METAITHIRPKFLQTGRYKGTLLDAISIKVKTTDLKKLTSVELTHWPVRTKSGSADFRYRPIHKTWTLDHFVQKLQAVVALGDRASDVKATQHNDLFSSSPMEIASELIAIRYRSVYLPDWSYHRLYEVGGFEAFALGTEQISLICSEVSPESANK